MTLCTIYKKILFSTLLILSSIRNFFSKYTDSYTKKYKLYNNLLNKISPETKLLVLGPSNKNRPTPVSILYTPISSTQNNPPTHFSLPSLSLSLCQARFTPGWKSAGWTRRWADLWNNLGFSLCAAPPVCRVVATSDEGEGVRGEVSTDWCVAVEHRRSSSIRDYLRRLSD